MKGSFARELSESTSYGVEPRDRQIIRAKSADEALEPLC